MREHIAAKGPIVTVGYRRKKEERGLHPSGVRELLVHNAGELEAAAAAAGTAVRIAATVGKRKRGDIETAAAELGLRVLNPSRT
jgi:large subunit ribosomal protein L32e